MILSYIGLSSDDKATNTKVKKNRTKEYNEYEYA